MNYWLALLLQKAYTPKIFREIAYFSNKPIDQLIASAWAVSKFHTQPANHQPTTHPATRPITFLSFSWTERGKILTIGIAQTSDYIQIKIKSQSSERGYIKTFNYIQIKIKMLTPQQEPPTPYKAQHQVLREWMFFAPSNKDREPKVGM